jgi:hypothetical protein
VIQIDFLNIAEIVWQAILLVAVVAVEVVAVVAAEVAVEVAVMTTAHR